MSFVPDNGWSSLFIAWIGSHPEDKHLAVLVMVCQRAIGPGGWTLTPVIQQNWRNTKVTPNNLPLLHPQISEPLNSLIREASVLCETVINRDPQLVKMQRIRDKNTQLTRGICITPLLPQRRNHCRRNGKMRRAKGKEQTKTEQRFPDVAMQLCM